MKKYGFTLIELLIFISILGIVLAVSFSFLASYLKSSMKGDSLNEVRTAGNYSLSIIEKFAASAKKAECLTSESLELTMLDGTSTIFSCTGGKLSSASAFLTSDLTSDTVTVSSCNFTCSLTEGLPLSLGIGFTISKGGTDSSASEKASQSFNGKVIVRNQRE